MRKELKKLRVELGITQKELGQVLGFSPNYVHRVESGMVDGSWKFWTKLKEYSHASSERMWNIYAEEGRASDEEKNQSDSD